MEKTNKRIKKLTPEQIENVKACKTAEEIIAVAKAEGIEITVGQAEEILKANKDNKLGDEELSKVTGGLIGIW